MNSIQYKGLEFFVFFVLVPISFALHFSPWVKLGVGFFGFVYVIFVLLKIENQKFEISKDIDWTFFWNSTIIKFVSIALITTLFVWITDSASLFNVIVNKPLKWLVLLVVYSVFSVYPQELIFRTFFFKRYIGLFKNDTLFIFVNAILFSLAHVFFDSLLVLIVTFLGGLLFAFTYKKTQSTLLVSIEHAIYGCWLFTVGMGEMLGFPV
ncbi:MAG: CPBP family intramembrane metalloprotease [Algibacter sp.]|uniref:CPBP family intramembrane glutamic endopeptidase n=1 Tax=Algibacter sp. TaxID=1872428 RepID=UPI0026122923|nr:CPBP family intramembrane glutamic endopeptidase [Algibacter sp.]MDG1730928.1 CPBP family intramembrane metalloprotease [Algibacter sp.]MDG2179061.1 CPBP family intramembrane metalloprotease [Algibacter sp.]